MSLVFSEEERIWTQTGSTPSYDDGGIDGKRASASREVHTTEEGSKEFPCPLAEFGHFADIRTSDKHSGAKGQESRSLMWLFGTAKHPHTALSPGLYPVSKGRLSH